VDRQVTLRIVLERPPAGVDFAVQKGRGAAYETILKQRSDGGDLSFEFAIGAAAGPEPRFTGPLVQGPPKERFLYIGIGTYAGQSDTPWSRRLKIHLSGITWKMLDAAPVLEARIPGTGRDGGPACASAWRPADGPGPWKPERK
jgi:hypothetical protein